MKRTPLVAIVVSIIVIVSMYLFLDIKPYKKNKIAIKELKTPIEKQEFINTFNNNLKPELRHKLDSWLTMAREDGDTLALDSLVKQYEALEQYNFSAYYRTLRAEILDSKESWELAGDRQWRVSQNAAYGSTFNTILLSEAVSSYEKAMEYDPLDLDLKTKLGETYMADPEQPMQGITMLLSVVEEDSMHVEANIALGRFGIVSGQYDKALDRIEKVLSLQPENTEALFLAAEAATNMGDIPYAISRLEESKAIIEDEDLKSDIDLLIKQLKK